VKGPPSSSSRDKVTKRGRGKERVEWGRGPWRAVLAFLPRGPRVLSYATASDPLVDRGSWPLRHAQVQPELLSQLYHFGFSKSRV